MTRFRSDQPNQANLPRAAVNFFDKEKTCIVTDLDGCLVHTWEMLQIYLWDRYGVWVPAEANDRFSVGYCLLKHLSDHFEDEPSLTKALWEGLWNNGLYYQNARPHYAYWQALVAWQYVARFPTVYLTARPPNLRSTTLGWLNRWGLNATPDNVILEDTSKDKLQHIEALAQSLESIVYVDDKISTILQVARAKLPNVKLVLFGRPWNLAKSPDWEGFVLEGQPALKHPEFDLFLHHGFDLGFRRLEEGLIAEAIREGLE